MSKFGLLRGLVGTQTRKGTIKRGFGIEMGGMKREERGNFPEKKFQKAWDWRQEIFQKKFFLGSENTKFCATSVAPRAPRPRGSPPPPYNDVFAMFAVIWRLGTVQKV